MDDPTCEVTKLHNTYRQFGIVNRLIAGWGRVYRRYLKPRMHTGETYHLLDVGFGGGDIPLRVARWAERDGLDLAITAIDPDARAYAYAQTRDLPDSILFRQATAKMLLDTGERFDFVVSNHLLHHLGNDELREMCRQTQRLANRLVLHSDIERGDLAYAGFALTRPFFRDSFITTDGLTSIRRSFTHRELRAAAPPGWHVERMIPYRNLLIYEP